MNHRTSPLRTSHMQSLASVQQIRGTCCALGITLGPEDPEKEGPVSSEGPHRLTRKGTPSSSPVLGPLVVFGAGSGEGMKEQVASAPRDRR